MNNDEINILEEDLDGDTRPISEKCRELIADVRRERIVAKHTKAEIGSLRNTGNILRGTIKNLETQLAKAKEIVTEQSGRLARPHMEYREAQALVNGTENAKLNLLNDKTKLEIENADLQMRLAEAKDDFKLSFYYPEDTWDGEPDEMVTVQKGQLRAAWADYDEQEKRLKKHIVELQTALANTRSPEDLTLEDVKRKYFSNVSWEDLRGRTAKSIFDKIE